MNKAAFRLMFGASGLILLVAAIFQFRSTLIIEAFPRKVALKALLPVDVAGWSARDYPIADTEEMKRAVSELLNFDEALYRVYTRGSDQISVYVAYWRPGTMHSRLITQHLPEVCWPGNGWKLIQSEGTATLARPNGATTLPGQVRAFTAGAAIQHVIYWHLLGGKLSDYARGAQSRPATYHLTLWDDIRQGQQEQYFIRISSNLGISEMRDTAPLQATLAALAPLGLEESRP